MDDLLPIWDEPPVLFFSGVFPERYDMDVLFTNQLMSSLRESEFGETRVDDMPEEFDKVPAKFVSAESWPMSTNLRCLHCTRQFKTRPLTMITHIANENSVITEMRTCGGYMCSGDCVATYINTRIHDKRTSWERHKMFSIFYRKLTGIKVDAFPMTRDASGLKMFGGDTSLDDHIKSLKFVVTT